MKNPPQPTPMESLKDLLPLYDGYLVDLWGVVHDGAQVYPGVMDCLQNLQDQGKCVILLSNGPRRTHVAEDRLAQLGISRAMYTHVWTSGEQTYQFLRDQVQERPGQKFYHIGTERDVSLFEGLDLMKTEDIHAADFILCSDTFKWDQQVHDLDALFEQALSRQLPLICANPDRVVFYQGGLKLCAGSLAHRYEQMGGKITLIGKPYPQVYESVLALMPGIHPTRMLAIGDSLRTDIQGGLNQKIDGALITGGIHMPELGNAWGQLPTADAVERLCASYNITPRYVMGRFA